MIPFDYDLICHHIYAAERRKMEKEKIMILEVVMKAKIVTKKNGLIYFKRAHLDFSPTPLHDWNPNTDRDCWDEIWKKLTEVQKHDYKEELYAKIISNTADLVWGFHIIHPSICWDCLVKVIEEQINAVQLPDGLI